MQFLDSRGFLTPITTGLESPAYPKLGQTCAFFNTLESSAKLPNCGSLETSFFASLFSGQLRNNQLGNFWLKHIRDYGSSKLKGVSTEIAFCPRGFMIKDFFAQR
jgi:hypothetical protein